MQHKVLLVDDDEDFVKAMTTVLDLAGYAVLAAESGVEGVAKARSEKPDIIVLDVTMESAGAGFKVARSLRTDQATQAIPIIMLTAINKEEASLRYGPDEDWNPVDAFLDKPVTGDAVVAEIQRILPPRAG